MGGAAWIAAFSNSCAMLYQLTPLEESDDRVLINGFPGILSWAKRKKIGPLKQESVIKGDIFVVEDSTQRRRKDFEMSYTDQECKSSAYRKGEEQKDGMELLNERLAANLRQSVRKLGSYPVLSPPWIEMVPCFARMATVTEMEGSLPQQKDATIWETEEHAVRYVMEDGKLNLMLRSMIDFKAHVYNARNKPDELELKSNAAICDEFELSLGRVLYCCWTHVEALQTTEVAPLMEYISEVLQRVLCTEGALDALLASPNLALKQEVQVLLYVGQLLLQVETMREVRVMPFIRKSGVFGKMAVFLLRAHASLPPHILLRAIAAISAVVETEDYTTYTAVYLNKTESGEGGGVDGVDTLDALLELRDQVLAPLLKSLPRDQRFKVKPLSDAIDKCQRLSRK